mmetsp:Transcript_18574/g.43952  ORF Transcript_18574/g.43952 Transcript_18574/m.43952 type:complete len:231 (-) Transcript_18574:935-1627(-)
MFALSQLRQQNVFIAFLGAVTGLRFDLQRGEVLDAAGLQVSEGPAAVGEGPRRGHGPRAAHQIPAEVQLLRLEDLIERPQAGPALFPKGGGGARHQQQVAAAGGHHHRSPIKDVRIGLAFAEGINVVGGSVWQVAGFCVPLQRLEDLFERYVPGGSHEEVRSLRLCLEALRQAAARRLDHLDGSLPGATILQVPAGGVAPTNRRRLEVPLQHGPHDADLRQGQGTVHSRD